MAKVSKNIFERSQAEVTVGSHPERLLILAVAWCAMVAMGVVGASTIVNPESRLPVIDPLLEAIARSKQPVPPQDIVQPEATEHINLVPTLTADEAYLEEYLQDLEEVPTPVTVEESPAEAQPVDVVESDPSANPSTDSSANPSTGNQVPIWLYWAILLSCSAGSTVVTVLLYRLTRPLPSAADLQKSQLSAQKARQLNVKRSKSKFKSKFKSKAKPKSQLKSKAKDSVTAAQQQVKQQQPQTQIKAPKVNVPSVTNVNISDVNISDVNIPAIAPLHISTPDDVETPKLNIEPVVDPQPTPTKKVSRADRLAKLAQRAKQQPPKRLVDMMDIRRRNHLAPFS